MQEILKNLETLIREHLDNETISLKENTLFESLEEWDSMEQVAFISIIEEVYKFKFSIQEMTAMSMAKSAGEMAAVIAAKLE